MYWSRVLQIINRDKSLKDKLRIKKEKERERIK